MKANTIVATISTKVGDLKLAEIKFRFRNVNGEQGMQSLRLFLAKKLGKQFPSMTFYKTEDGGVLGKSQNGLRVEVKFEVEVEVVERVLITIIETEIGLALR